MTQEIKSAVSEGKTVIWNNNNYVVKKYSNDNYQIVCDNGHRIGLTWEDGKTLNAKEEDFKILKGVNNGKE